jgi:DNA helicase-2/ATP-dependent DNA helicase PcrA
LPASSQPNLTVVGDDSQAIYKFRGASVSNILTFMKDYPQAKKVTLRFNYRSDQAILDAAYRLIKNNDPDTLEHQLGISKELKAVTDDHNQSAVNLILTEKAEDEARAVAKPSWISKKKSVYSFSDFALW